MGEGAGARSFDVEVVATESSRAAGLMHRRTLSRGSGMLFDFLAEQHVRMWMKNTRISLDMLFIDSDGLIRRIEEYAVPFSLRAIPSMVPVRYVLELGGGEVRRLGIVPGERCDFSDAVP